MRSSLIQTALPFALLVVLAGIALPAAADPNPASLYSERGAWPMYRQWTFAETLHFARWIENMYEVKANGTASQRLAKLEQVLTDPEMNLLLDPGFLGEPSNPQLERETMHAMHQVIDCGKLTIALGAYYAYRRGLPWMNSRIVSGDGGDIRRSAFNVPVGVVSNLDYESRHKFFVDCVYGFNTGNYRIDPYRENAELSDTIPIAIDRRFMIPGTLFYFDGHVMILSKVDEHGEVYFLDSTTSPSRGIYAQHGFNAVTGVTPKSNGSNPVEAYAGCYRGFRAFRYPIAEVDETGEVTHVRRRSNEEMREFGYSTEQYERVRDLATKQRIVEGRYQLESFHEFVRTRMRTANSIDPAREIEAFATEFLAALRAREERVQAGWRDVRQHGPVVFPDGTFGANAFDAQGRWGQFATAETDANLRMQYFRLQSMLENAVAWARHEPGAVRLGKADARGWTPSTLAMALTNLKASILRDKTFTYTNSAGKPVRLSLLDVEKRLYDLSFDPNHPPELRWGAPANSAERRTALDSPTVLPDGSSMAMNEAYRRQIFYRTVTYRETDETYLRDMFTEGFPIREKTAPHMMSRWGVRKVPVLLPHIERPARAGQAQQTARRDAP